MSGGGCQTPTHCTTESGCLGFLLASLERGHELGSRRKDWPYPSAQWVRECREKLEQVGRPR